MYLPSLDQQRIDMPALFSCWYLFSICNASHQHDSEPMVSRYQYSIKRFFTIFSHPSMWYTSRRSHGSQPAVKSSKAIYAELFGLSKKGIDCALKANMQHELVNLLKA